MNGKPEEADVMTVATSLRSGSRMAAEVLFWAFGFYVRHFLLIAGISLVVSAERFAFVMWAFEWPAAVNVVLEALVVGVRLLLMTVIVWLAIYQDSGLRRQGHEERWERMRAFTRERWSALVVQIALLAVALVLFDLVPDRIIILWVPNEAEALYTASLLAIKNPTVIAFTFIWMVSIVRQMMLYSPTEPENRASANVHR